MKIEKRISKARTALLMDFPWFGSLAMNLRMESNDSIPTFDVDGTTMRYNPEFADSLNNKELAGVIAHEVMHCALLHIFRRGTRDAEMWNYAADYAINQELIDSGLTLPKGCLLDSKYKGLSAEVIYSQLKQQRKQGKNKQGKTGQEQQQGTGQFSDAPQGQQKCQKDKQQGSKAGKGQQGQQDPTKGQGQPEQGQMSEQDWKIAAEQAAKVAKAAGKLPGNLGRMITESRKSQTDWRQELREFLEQTVPSDYSWQQPNRRFINQGLYLPGVVKEGFGTLAVAVDTSGSIDQAQLNAFASELTAICSELKPEKIVVMYCDTQINKTQEFTSDDEIKLAPYGGGGTYFEPVFKEVNGWDEPPKALLYFTDLYNGDNPKEPDYPTLWVTGLNITKQAPFGRAIRIEI